MASLVGSAILNAMPNLMDLTGASFGRWTVIGRSDERRGRATMWRCRCQCGNEKDVPSVILRRGISQSCGCIKCPDITGQKLGRYTVEERVERGDGRSWWRCRCECGAVKTVRGSRLRDGDTVSCGCYAADMTAARSRIHGASKTPEHKVWSGMIERCNDNADPNYGGRGIDVCRRWRESFAAFLEDMGPRPTTPGRWSIDRIDNDGNYEPGNCRWTVTRVQCRNMRTNRILEYNGRRLTVAGWADVLGVHQDILYDRLRDGWSAERALTQPVRQQKRSRFPELPPLDVEM